MTGLGWFAVGVAAGIVGTLGWARAWIAEKSHTEFFRGWDQAAKHWPPSASSPVAYSQQAAPSSLFVTHDDVTGTIIVESPEGTVT